MYDENEIWYRMITPHARMPWWREISPPMLVKSDEVKGRPAPAPIALGESGGLNFFVGRRNSIAQ